MHGVGERHLAVLVVVAVALAVGGDVGELSFGFGLGGDVGQGRAEAVQQAGAEGFAAVQQAFEGDGAGGRGIVKEDGDAAALVEPDEVGVGGVDGGVGVGGGSPRRVVRGWLAVVRCCGRRSRSLRFAAG